MLPSRLSSVAVVLACLLACAPLRAEVVFLPSKKQEWTKDFGTLKPGYKRWFSTGRDMFRISMPTSVDGISMGSTLDYQKMNTAMDIFSAEVRPLRYLSFEFQYGKNSFNSGQGYDHDWIHAPGFVITSPSGYVYNEPDHEDWSESVSVLSGSTRLMMVNGYLRVLCYRSKEDEETITQSLDLSLGYIWYDDKIRMREGTQTERPDAYMNWLYGLPPIGPFDGLDSSYDVHWDGLRFGLRETSEFTPTLHAEGVLGWAPFARYEGIGIWNLRTDFRHDPSFRHDARGRMLDFSVSLVYKPIKYASLQLGYMGCWANAHSGTDTTFFANGAEGQTSLEQVKSQRFGFFGGLSVGF
ncbi:MAG: hypothetical protein HY922_11625 [Elusimicrobia bacterium]|nr:hypothetical protein [Elusimicrobiota bacterium]